MIIIIHIIIMIIIMMIIIMMITIGLMLSSLAMMMHEAQRLAPLDAGLRRRLEDINLII